MDVKDLLLVKYGIEALHPDGLYRSQRAEDFKTEREKEFEKSMNIFKKPLDTEK